MARIFRGNPPKNAVLLDMTPDAAWALYRKPSINPVFGNFKLVSMGPRENKANFHFGFYIADGKLTRHNDAKVLDRLYPDLCQWVVDTLRRHYAKSK